MKCLPYTQFQWILISFLILIPIRLPRHYWKDDVKTTNRCDHHVKYFMIENNEKCKRTKMTQVDWQSFIYASKSLKKKRQNLLFLFNECGFLCLYFAISPHSKSWLWAGRHRDSCGVSRRSTKHRPRSNILPCLFSFHRHSSSK